MMSIRRILPILILSVPTYAEPLLYSWLIDQSSTYAELFESHDDEENHNEVHTWSQGAGVQALPTYSGVNEVSYSEDWVYIRTTGLGHHIMGPWYLNEANTQLFPNFPANVAAIYRFPRTASSSSSAYEITSGGAIGYFVDGVAMFDCRDAVSYINNLGTDGTPNGGNGRGDGIWNRDAYENERVTFDSANAHQASDTYHYHANPTALRYLLDDHVEYHENNTYTEKAGIPTHHSPIIGWVSDGYPVYGPYGYADANNSESGIKRMTSGYQKRVMTDRTSYPDWASRMYAKPALSTAEYGPNITTQFPIGHYIEDYEYMGDVGLTQGIDFDLDEHNGRFCITPDFPNGTYAYFITCEDDGTPVFPYNIGRAYYGTPSGGSVNELAQTIVIFAEGGAESAIKATLLTLSDHCKLQFDGAEGGHYKIEFSTNLTDGFSTLITNLTSSSHHFEFTHSNTYSQSGFYRVIIERADAYDDEGYDSGVDMHDSIDTVITNLYVSPSSGHPGEIVSITITLNNDDFGRSVPPLQHTSGVSIPVHELTVGNINTNNISNIVRVNRFTTTFDLTIPANQAPNIVDIIIRFMGPSGNTPTFTITDGFVIE